MTRFWPSFQLSIAAIAMCASFLPSASQAESCPIPDGIVWRRADSQVNARYAELSAAIQKTGAKLSSRIDSKNGVMLLDVRDQSASTPFGGFKTHLFYALDPEFNKTKTIRIVAGDQFPVDGQVILTIYGDNFRIVDQEIELIGRIDPTQVVLHFPISNRIRFASSDAKLRSIHARILAPWADLELTRTVVLGRASTAYTCEL